MQAVPNDFHDCGAPSGYAIRQQELQTDRSSDGQPRRPVRLATGLRRLAPLGICH